MVDVFILCVSRRMNNLIDFYFTQIYCCAMKGFFAFLQMRKKFSLSCADHIEANLRINQKFVTRVSSLLNKSLNDLRIVSADCLSSTKTYDTAKQIYKSRSYLWIIK